MSGGEIEGERREIQRSREETDTKIEGGREGEGVEEQETN